MCNARKADSAWRQVREMPLQLEGSSASTKKGKRQVSKETFDKRQRLYEREHQSMTWLLCDVDKGKQKKSLVSTLRCGVCRKYEERIGGLMNFSRAWIKGSSNHIRRAVS